jgi:GT2 family glycosyltransferase
MRDCRFSIIVTCFNQRSFIREAIESALVQRADEVIVVDDGSNDGSAEILQEYRDRLRLCPVAENGGAPRARNHGALTATGDYLMFLDGDDVLAPWALAVYERVLERHKAVLVLGETVSFRGSVPAVIGDLARGPITFREYAVPMAKDRSATLVGSALVVERDAFLAAGGWTPEIFHGDIKDLMMKLGYAGPLVLIHEPVTAFYRIHEKNSIHEVAKFIANAHRILARERAGRYPGGAARRGERYAALGAFVVYWSTSGMRAGLWKQTLQLLWAGLPMVVAAVAQRTRNLARRSGKPERLDLDLSSLARARANRPPGASARVGSAYKRRRVDTSTDLSTGRNDAITTSPSRSVPESVVWIDPLTDRGWRDLLAGHSSACTFHSRGWLEALRRTYGYQPVALATRTRTGSLKSAFVFCRVKSRWTGNRLVSLPFSDHCDALYERPDDVEVLVRTLQKCAPDQKYIELRPLNTFCANGSGFAPNDQYLLHRLPLQEGANAVFRRFHKNHVVRKIRRAEREGLVYEEGSSDRLLRCFYELTVRTRRRHLLPPQPIAWFRAVLDCLPAEARIRVAFKDRMPIASMLTVSDGTTMTYKYGASDASHHNSGGVQFLMWKTIQDACSQGCTTMDFGRSRPESAGEVAFKDHWGGTRTSLMYWRYPGSGQPARSGDNLNSARRIVSVLPDRLLIVAGTAIYKHVG